MTDVANVPWIRGVAPSLFPNGRSAGREEGRRWVFFTSSQGAEELVKEE